MSTQETAKLAGRGPANLDNFVTVSSLRVSGCSISSLNWRLKVMR